MHSLPKHMYTHLLNYNYLLQQESLGKFNNVVKSIFKMNIATCTVLAGAHTQELHQSIQ